MSESVVKFFFCDLIFNCNKLQVNPTTEGESKWHEIQNKYIRGKVNNKIVKIKPTGKI